MNFSFIIINYNTYELTAQCLRSIFAHCRRPAFEIIVIDNHSADGSIQKLNQEFGEQITVIANLKNLGFSRANNQGAAIAKGRYLFFLNSDTLLTADILTPLKNILESNPRLGAVAPRLRLADGSWQSEAHGQFPTIFNIIRGKIIKERQPLPEQKILKTDWISGAALMIKKEIFMAAGGWDEAFFLYLEDADLCWRIKKLGYQIAVLNEISVIHLLGQSLKKIKEKRKYYYQSQDYFFAKHYGWTKKIIMQIIRWPYKFWVLHK